jgi:membrane protein implicated in regulation of membrane protease activity
MAKPFAVERALELSASVTLVGVVLTVISLADITTGTASLGGWSMWALVVGFIAFAFGLYWLAGYLRNVRDFKKLIEEQSKAALIKNLDDIEYLAWKLPIRFEEELQERKKRLGVK